MVRGLCVRLFVEFANHSRVFRALYCQASSAIQGLFVKYWRLSLGPLWGIARPSIIMTLLEIVSEAT